MTAEAEAASVPFEQSQEQGPRIYDVTRGLKSKHTKTAYRIAFNHFQDVTIKSKDLRALLDTKQNVIEDKIIDHITSLKDGEGLTYRSILVHLSAIFHFFEINDYDDLRRRKIKRFLPEDESDHYAKSNPSFVRALKDRIGEDSNYEQLTAYLKSSYGTANYNLTSLIHNMFVIPVPFSKEHKSMLSHTKQMMEYDNGRVAINPQFTKLITSLRTAVADEWSLDKEATSHDDLFDSFRLSLQFWH